MTQNEINLIKLIKTTFEAAYIGDDEDTDYAIVRKRTFDIGMKHINCLLEVYCGD